MKLANRSVVLLLVLIFIAQLALTLYGKLPTATSYRLSFISAVNGNAGLALAQKWNGLPYNQRALDESDDDRGATYALAAATYLQYGPKELSERQEFAIPWTYFAVMALPYLATLLMLYFNLAHSLGKNAAFVFALVVALSRDAYFIAFSGDSYFFPAFALVLSFAGLRLSAQNPRRGFSVGLFCGIVLFACDFFRSSSFFLWPAVLFGLFRPSLRNFAVGLSLTLVVLSLSFTTVRHPFWNSLHAGLFEFGGWRDTTSHTAAPAFAVHQNPPATAIFENHWNDEFEAELIRQKDPGFRLYGSFRPEYERLMRDSFLALLKEYPEKFDVLLGKRVWRALVVNPWQKTTHDSQILFAEPQDTILRLLLVVVILLGFYKGLVRQQEVQYLLCLGAIAAPVLLVHSGYIMYSLPFHLWLGMLWIYSLKYLILQRNISE